MNRIETETLSGNPEIILVTSLSGAGLSSALKALEDLDYEVFDNFPLAFVPHLLAESSLAVQPVALGIDARSREFDPHRLLQIYDHLKSAGKRVFLLCLICDNDVLQQRYSETRRKHPLARDGRPLMDGIVAEKKMFLPVIEAADWVIDTSHTKLPDLQRILRSQFQKESGSRLHLTLMSFGFKFGLPREADLVLDVRFLRNPYWDPVLRPLTGKEVAVREYVQADPDYLSYRDTVHSLLQLSLPRFVGEGKTYLTVAIGCTGGQHRSVTLIEDLAMVLRHDYPNLTILHRDCQTG